MADWSHMEAKAADDLRPKLQSLLDLCSQARDLIPETVEAIAANYPEGAPVSFQVQTRLLNRMGSELRVIELCCVGSYVVQALTMCSVLFEHAHVVAYVGIRDDRGREWLSHSNPARSYPPIRMRKLIAESIRIQGRPAEDIDDEEQSYRFLCMAKHGNPQMLRGFGVVTGSESVTLAYGPFLSKLTHRQARLALWQGSRLVLMALYTFGVQRATDAQIPIAERIVAVLSAVSEEGTALKSEIAESSEEDQTNDDAHS